MIELITWVELFLGSVPAPFIMDRKDRSLTTWRPLDSRTLVVFGQLPTGVVSLRCERRALPVGHCNRNCYSCTSQVAAVAR